MMNKCVINLIVSIVKECGKRYDIDVSDMIEEYESSVCVVGVGGCVVKNVKGRPKKEKRKIGLSDESSDLFAELLANVSGDSSDSERENIV